MPPANSTFQGLSTDEAKEFASRCEVFFDRSALLRALAERGRRGRNVHARTRTM